MSEAISRFFTFMWEASLIHESLVIFVFIGSWILWRKVLMRYFRKASDEKLCQKTDSSAEVVRGDRRFASVRERDGGLRSRSGAGSHASGSRRFQTDQHVTQMLRLLEQKEFTRALNHWRSLERDGFDSHFTDEHFFAEFLQSACRVGKVDVCDRFLRTMKKNGVSPSLQFWQSLFKMLSSRRLYQACLQAFSLFEPSILPDRTVYSCLINAALECNQAAEAVKLLPTYRRADLEPKDYILFFRAYAACNNLDGAISVFRELREEVTSLMLNLLLLTCVNVNRPEDAFGLLQEAKGYEKTRLSKGDAAAGSRIVDTVSYNTLIKGFAQSDLPNRCFECLHDMRSHGLEPDDVTFGSLLDVCIADNDISKAHTVIDTLMRGDRPMDTVMCTLFIKGFVRVGNLAKAMELYGHMKLHEDAKPDIVTYSVLIKALVEDRDMEKALHLVEEMLSAGHCPDDIILTHLLEGCRHIGNQPLGKKLFEDMVLRGVRPSEFTLMTLVKLNGRCGTIDEAKDLIETWEAKYGTKPTVIHYTCLMSGCLRAKKPEAAWEAYELMCRNQMVPDDTTFATMIPGMSVAQRWDNVLTLANRAAQFSPGPALPADALNNALSAMLNAGQVRPHAQRLHSIMVRAKVPVTVRNIARRLQTVQGTDFS